MLILFMECVLILSVALFIVVLSLTIFIVMLSVIMRSVVYADFLYV